MARIRLILSNSIGEANQFGKLAGLPRFSYRAVRDAGAIRGVRNAEVYILPSFLRRPDRHGILQALNQAKTLEVFYCDIEDLKRDAARVDLETALGLAYPDPRGPLTDLLLEEAYFEQADRAFTDYRQRYVAGLEQIGTVDGAPVFVNHEPLSYDASWAQGPTLGRSVASAVWEESQTEAWNVPTEETSAIIEELNGDEAGTPESSEEPAPAPKKRRRTRCPKCETLHFPEDACRLTRPAPVAADDFFV